MIRLSLARTAPALAALAAIVTAFATPAHAQQSYPNAPVKWVVPFAPGGVADATSRIVGEKLGEKLGQRVIIENIPGAGGINAARAVLNAPADGHTLALLTNGTSISVALFNKLPFDPVTQFDPVSAVGFFEFIFYTGANTPYKTLADVVKAARAKPGEITVGTIFAGSTQHLTMELFKSLSGTDVRHVPFKGTPDLLLSGIRGDVAMMVEALAPVKSNLEDGKVRALAVSSATPSLALPGVPPAGEAVNGFDVVSWNAIFVKAGTPAPIVAQLNKALNEVLAMDDVKKRLLQLGIESRGSTPAEIKKRMVDDIAKWGDVIAKAGIAKR